MRPHRTAAVLAATALLPQLVVAQLVAPQLLAAQVAAGVDTSNLPVAQSRAPADAADALYLDGRVRESLDLLETHLSAPGADPRAHWLAARAAVTLGITASDEEEEERWLERGIGHAERAVRADSASVDARFWLVASRGWLAMVVGNPRRIAGLADYVFREARALEREVPDHAGVQHALGKLHFEAMTLSGFERFLGRWLLGIDVLKVSTWDLSVRHLERAVELDPASVLYHYDLALTYDRSGDPERAVAELRTALELPSVRPPDDEFKRRASAYLRRLTRADAPTGR